MEPQAPQQQPQGVIPPQPPQQVPSFPPSTPPAQPGVPEGFPPIGTPSSSSSKAPLIIGIVVGVVVLLFVAVFAYFYLTGMAVIKASDNFMKYETAGDTTKALTYTSASTTSEKAYIINTSEKTKGTSKRLEQKAADGKVYFLYSLSNSTYKYARTTLERVDGTWKITGYDISATKLSVLPGNSASGPNVTMPTTTTGATCLVASDFDTFYLERNGVARPANQDYSSTPYTGNVHFEPDSLGYSAPASVNTDTITAFANFAKQHSTKDFTIHLRGSVATTSQADLAFATQRATKIKDALIAQGAPSAKVVVDAPGSVADFGGDNSDETNKRTARSVVLTIDPTCTDTDANSGR